MRIIWEGWNGVNIWMEVMGNRGTVEGQQWERAPLVLPETFVKNVKPIESVNKQLQVTNVKPVTKVKTVSLNIINSSASAHFSYYNPTKGEFLCKWHSQITGDMSKNMMYLWKVSSNQELYLGICI